jgi:hypothetical protein
MDADKKNLFFNFFSDSDLSFMDAHQKSRGPGGVHYRKTTTMSTIKNINIRVYPRYAIVNI